MDAFWRLSAFRTQGFGGPDPIQPGTLRDWCEITGTRLSVEEIDILLAVDAAYLAAVRREHAAGNEGGGNV